MKKKHVPAIWTKPSNGLRNAPQLRAYLNFLGRIGLRATQLRS